MQWVAPCSGWLHAVGGSMQWVAPCSSLENQCETPKQEAVSACEFEKHFNKL